MFSGDSLQVLLFFVGLSLAAMMGAVAAPNSQARAILWSLMAFFGLAALTWLLVPTASPILQRIAPTIIAIAKSGVWVMLGTVFIVSQMMRSAKPIANQQAEKVEVENPPSFAATSQERTKWQPDMSLFEAAIYIGKHSRWGKQKPYLKVQELVNQIKEALEAGKLHAWGKAHPEDEKSYQIKKWLWRQCSFTLDKNYVFLDLASEAAHDVQFSKGEVEAAYPPSDEQD